MLEPKALSLALCLLSLGLGGATSPAPRARYVAMGSSFAAGPGVTESADTPANRCARSIDNYAHQLARKRNLDLVDVSCNAATTTNVLEGQNGLPPQIDSLTPDTRLVTITIGGNDVGYIGGLIAASCHYLAGEDAAAAQKCNQSFAPTEEQWAKAEQGMDRIITEVRRRSPAARLVFVDYLTAIPDRGTCAGLPLSPRDRDKSHAVAKRLVELTARVTRRAKVELLQASALSRSHSVCAAGPWVLDYHPLQLSGPHLVVPYHPTLAGMTAIANALNHMLGR